MVRFRYKQISNSRQMGKKRSKDSIKFLVVHFTGNDSVGANAEAHYRYLQGATRYGSAHYFVDEDEIIQVIGDSITAWAVGDNQGYGRALNGCTNENSISVEMCINSDGNFEKTYFNTVELFKELLRQYPKAKVCRHYDVSRKACPGCFVGKNSYKWYKFLEDIKQNRRLILDLTKDSEGVSVLTSEDKLNPKAVKKSEPTQPKFKGYFVLTHTPGDVLNVRANATVSSKKVSSYRDGSKIYVHQVIKNQEATWYKIEYKKGTFGYVSAKYCRGIK